MKIYNRQSVAERVFRGRGGYILLLPLRMLLSVLYRIIISVRTSFRRAGKRKGGGRKRGRARVISIGNILVGGGGKTPCSLALAEELVKCGMEPVILTRGYRSIAEKAGIPVLLADDPGLEDKIGFLTEADFNSPDIASDEYASVFGDEVTIYRNAGLPVVIDPDRKRGEEAATRVLHRGYIIMDDGFQNISVDKDMDILLLDHGDPFSSGRLLPWGRLREPPGAVRRADAVIFTRSRSDKIPLEARPLIEGKEVFFSRHECAGLFGRDGNEVALDELDGKKIALYSGIARPEGFEDMFSEQVTEPDFSFRFSDHHQYDEEDIRFLTGKVPPGTAFITTEKDWYKSAELFQPDTDIYLLRLKMVIDNLDKLIRLVLSV